MALVLSRLRDESIVIGDDVVITVMEIRGAKVRLGITAPGASTVHRHEVWLAIQAESGKPATPANELLAKVAERLARIQRRHEG